MFDFKQKFQKVKIIFVIFFLIFFGVVIFITNYSGLKKPLTQKTKASGTNLKPIRGTFIMFDFGFNTQAQFEPMFNEMKSLGIDTIILLVSGIVDRSPCQLGSTTPLRETSLINDQLKNLLKVARANNFSVFMGTAQNNGNCVDFTKGIATDQNSEKGRIIDYTVRLLDELKNYFNSQGWDWNNNSFLTGFYITQEMEFHNFQDNSKIDFYVSLSNRLKQKYPNKLLLLSPSSREEKDYDDAYQGYKNLLSKTKVDIIAPQDSMGTGLTKTVAADTAHFRGLRDAVAQFPGRQAWANIESFKASGVTFTYAPATIESFKAQIETARPYVTNMITWIYQHSMLTLPNFYEMNSWTNNYTADNAIKRQLLKDRYLDLYVYGGQKVENVFVWGSNLVVKGKNFGMAGSNVGTRITYLDNNRKIKQFTFSGKIIQENNKHVIYIPLVSLPAFTSSNIFTASIVEGEGSVSPSPTTSPVPTKATNSYPLKTSNFQPQVVTAAVQVQVSCDYGKVIGCLTVSSDGFSSCRYERFSGTTAIFSCTAKASIGSFPVYCRTFPNTADNCTNAYSKIGDLKIQAAPVSPTATPDIKWVFSWGETFVVKGYKFGTPGTEVTVVFRYSGQEISVRRTIVQEGGEHVIYVPKTYLPNFDPSGSYNVTIR